MTTEPNILPTELAQIVQSVFGTMLSLEIAQSEAPWFPSEDRLTAAVYLAGEWNGAVMFECDRRQACLLAGRFLSIDPPEKVDDLVCDVLGELANMIGGNLKCVLTRDIQLSIPSVVDGSHSALRVCRAVIQGRLAFSAGDGAFWITVVASRS